MNDFLVDYLKQMILVPFQIKQGTTFLLKEENPVFTVTFHRELDKRELLSSTSLALGEAYMRGEIELDRDLYEVLDLLLGQIGKFCTNKSRLRKLLYPVATRKNQEKAVCRHYDIGNDFYSLWLDATLSYSCGYFKSQQDSLYQAQVQKVDHILEKLQLKEGMTLLDIGCGWGFLLKRAVEKYGVKGVGITLSKEQYRYATEQIRQENLQESIRIKLMDYRDLKHLDKKFDRIVSVGMIEHVGRDHYDEFLSCASHVLKNSGLFLLHYISAQKEYPGDPWIKKYIFPGGMIPSLREIVHMLPEKNFCVLDVESLRRHYAKTLLLWRGNFNRHTEEIEKRYGIEFVRMWELYLASCAAAFHNGVVDLHQILMSKGVNNEIPMLRKR